MGQAYLGSTELNKLYLGTTQINKVIGPYSIVNTEVINWVNATDMTNPRIWRAVDEFVSGCKIDAIWSKFFAIYPLITDSTNTATIKNQFKYNLVNTNLYTLAYNGSSTVGYDGYTNGGTNSYINTNLNPLGSSLGGDLHMSLYTPDIFANASQAHMGAFYRYVIGVGTFNEGYGLWTTGSTQACCQFAGGENNTTFIAMGGGNPNTFRSGTDQIFVNNATGSGLWFSSNTYGVYPSVDCITYYNGSALITNAFSKTVQDNMETVDTPILLGAMGYRIEDYDFEFPFGFSTLTYSFFTIGNSFTADEASAAYNRIQTLQEQIDSILGTSRAV